MAPFFFEDMDSPEATKWSKALCPTALSTCTDPAPDANVHAWRISVLMTKDKDSSMPLGFQQHLVEKGRAAGATIDSVEEISSGHFVQITHPKEVVDWIKKVIA